MFWTFMRKWEINIHLVTKLPFGVNIKDLIDDLKILSWEASDVLTYYSRILRETNNKSNIIKRILNRFKRCMNG